MEKGKLLVNIIIFLGLITMKPIYGNEVQISESLNEIGGKLSQLEKEILNLEKRSSNEESGIWGEIRVKLNAESMDNQLKLDNPYIYNALRIPLKVADGMNLRTTVFSRMGFGSNSHLRQLNTIETSLDTTIPIGDYKLGITVGEYVILMTPLTLYNINQRGKESEQKNIFVGMRADSNLPNLKLNTSVSKVRDGGGFQTDQYMYTLQGSTEIIPNLIMDINHWRSVPDRRFILELAPRSMESITGIKIEYPIRFFNFIIPINCEMALSIQDRDVTDNLLPTYDHALVVEGKIPLKVRDRGYWRLHHLNFSYKRIGPKYISGGLSGVRDWEDDFIIDQEEELFDCRYIRNFQGIELKISEYKPLQGLTMSFNSNFFSELTPSQGAGRRSYKASFLNIHFIPRTKLLRMPLHFEGLLEQYHSMRVSVSNKDGLDIKNSIYGIYHLFDIGRQMSLKVGNELHENKSNGTRLNRELRPTVVLTKSILGRSNLSIQFQHITKYQQGTKHNGHYWQIKMGNSVSGAIFALDYEGVFFRNKPRQSLNLTYSVRY